MKRIKILANYYETIPGGDRVVKFKAGDLFDPKDEGAQRQLALENAELVEVTKEEVAAAEKPAADAAAPEAQA